MHLDLLIRDEISKLKRRGKTVEEIADALDIAPNAVRDYKKSEPRLNERFFDKDTDLKWYVVGLAMSTYTPSKNDETTMIFRSKYEHNIEVIKKAFGTNAEIKEDTRRNEKGKPRNSFYIRVASSYMRRALKSLGLGDDKYSRRWPNPPEEYMRAFIRGFFDGQGHPSANNGKSSIFYEFSDEILKKQQNIFETEAGVTHRKVIKGMAKYWHEDALRIFRYMYENLPNNANTYLREKKEKFVFTDLKAIRDNRQAESEKRKIAHYAPKVMLLAHHMMEDGMLLIDAAKKAGFSHYNTAYKGWRFVTGEELSRFVKEFSPYRRNGNNSVN